MPSLTALPSVLQRYAGRILDADSHEYTPVNLWEEQFGSVVRPFVKAFENSKMPIKAFVADDVIPIDDHSVWNTKFAWAPGAFDLDRRLAVMNHTGVDRQMMFPGSIGLYAVSFYYRADEYPDMFRSIERDRREYALSLVDAYNDYCVRAAKHSDRIRAVAVAIAPSVERLYGLVRHLVSSGVRAVWMPSATLPGGVSPAHPDLDPVWDLLAVGDVPVLAHLGADFDFLKTAGWRNAPAFQGWKAGEEFQMDPWTLSTLHLPVQNFVATMVMGGVFERHPSLRFGACEVLGQWVGPLAQNLDFWHANSRKFSLDNTDGELPITMPPSDYFRRNIRVSLFDIEPVDTYIEQFGMPELYCYSSDYPHPEGGRDPMGMISGRLERFGEPTLRQVFTENAQLLLPD